MGQARSTKGSDDLRAKKNVTGAQIDKHLVVRLDSTEGQMGLPATTTDPIYGVTIGDVPDGDMGDVQIRGRAVIKAGGALPTPGVRVMSNAAGKVIAWAAAAGTNAHVVGTLETTSAAEDDLVEVELAGPGVVAQG